ncbi:hypothetical protein FHG87_023789 [Trinorchestia longiramus]|nr:hypothetical protein FHG87_023789 [Trinorchestia longiramus]
MHHSSYVLHDNYGTTNAEENTKYTIQERVVQKFSGFPVDVMGDMNGHVGILGDKVNENGPKLIDHQLGRLVSESACERKDPGSNPAADMVDAARNTAWDLGIQPNNYRSNYLTQEWARRFVPIA